LRLNTSRDSTDVQGQWSMWDYKHAQKKKKNTLKGKTSPPAGQLREMQERVPVPQ